MAVAPSSTLAAPRAASAWPSDGLRWVLAPPDASILAAAGVDDGQPAASSPMLRMKTRAQFQAVLSGTTVARTSHFALHRRVVDTADLSRPSDANRKAAPLFDGQGPWLGAMVPKRWARRAVTRNAIKRQIYQVSAGTSLGEPQAAYLVRLRSGFDKARFPSASSDALKLAVREELQRLFDRAR